MAVGDEGPGSDPAGALLRKGCLIFILGGFLLLAVPRAVFRMITGDAVDGIGEGLKLAFFGWLTWRYFLILQDNQVATTRGFWAVTAVGNSIFAAIAASFFLWLLATREHSARDLLAMALTMLVMLTLVASAALAARRCSSQPS